MKNIFQKNWFPFLILAFFLFIQLICGFLFPACGFSANWLPVSDYLPKFSAQESDFSLLRKSTFLISSEYRLNSDIGRYLETAANFGPEYMTSPKGMPYLNRPLYPFLILLTSSILRIFAPFSYGLIFGAAILLNFILAFLAVSLFFSLLKNFFSSKLAYLSSFLFIFSPFVHSFLVQPAVEMLIAFGVVASVWLLNDYIKKPAASKLIVYSLFIGIIMLGKMFYAISFFILLLAVYFKRHKEGFIFFIVHLLPVGLWYLWVTKVWQAHYYSVEVEQWKMGIWLLKIFGSERYEVVEALFRSVPYFITAFLYGFLFIPVIFSIIGFSRLPFRAKNLIYFGSIFSVFLLGFLINLYAYRHAFMLFPIIYPAAVLGIERAGERIGKFRYWCRPLFYALILGVIVFISNINFYKVFNFDYFNVAR